MTVAAQPKAADEPVAATADHHGRDLAAAEFERAHTAAPTRPIGLLFDAEDGTTGW